jgi:CheY-like chemotaxis protein
VTRTALVVDDDDSIRIVAEVALETVGGWEVLSVDNGRTALEVAASQQPDVVLLDVMMPGLDGMATLARLKDDPVTQAIPVVLVTAKIGVGEHDELGTLDVAGVITKPFDPMTLARDVAALVGWDD